MKMTLLTNPSKYLQLTKLTQIPSVNRKSENRGACVAQSVKR